MTQPKAETCRVMDLCATQGPRTHELIVAGAIKPVTFPERDFAEVPLDAALRLVGNPGFLVIGPEGQELRMRTSEPATPGAPAPGIVMRADQVVAALDELTMDALLKRANAIAGGEALRKSDGREKVMGFLAGHPDAGSPADGDRLGDLVSKD